MVLVSKAFKELALQTWTVLNLAIWRPTKAEDVVILSYNKYTSPNVTGMAGVF